MAAQQVERLYGRSLAVFPPPGLSCDDSYFAPTRQRRCPLPCRDWAKPVIVTGAQIPLREMRNDAHNNLVTALLLATQAPLSEVCLYFNGRLMRAIAPPRSRPRRSMPRFAQ